MPEDAEILNKTTLYTILKEVNLEQTNEIKREISNSTREILDKVEDNTSRIANLENKVQFLEKKLRRNNIVIFGVDIHDKSTLLKETTQRLNQLLGTDISESDINNIYLVDKKTTSKNPPIFLEFISLLKKQSVFANVTKLKGTGVAISNDLSFEDRKQQKILVGHLRNAKEQNFNARIKGNKLEVNGRVYTAEDLKELENDIEETSEGEFENEEEIQQSQGEKIIKQLKDQKQEEKTKKIVQKRKRSKVVYSPKTRYEKQEAYKQKLKK